MKNQEILNQLKSKNIISESQASLIIEAEANRPFSIHWELRTLLYLGISFAMTGLGLLIYKNINTIGHDVLIALIALACIYCFYYTFKYSKPFDYQEVKQDKNLIDFVLLGGCLLFLALESYLQYQYNLFGKRYGIATLIPAVFFFFCAYRFDHRGVLSMGITALASTIGVTISPVNLWQSSNLNTQALIISAISLGIFLVAIGIVSEKRAIKKHFSFTYLLYGANLVFVAALVGLFNYDFKVVYFLIIAVMAFLSIVYARKTSSYLLLLLGVVFGYIAFSYSFFKILPTNVDFFFYQFYFFASAGGIIYFLINIKKIIKPN